MEGLEAELAAKQAQRDAEYAAKQARKRTERASTKARRDAGLAQRHALKLERIEAEQTAAVLHGLLLLKDIETYVVFRSTGSTTVAICSICGVLPGNGVPTLARIGQAELHLNAEHDAQMPRSWR